MYKQANRECVVCLGWFEAESIIVAFKSTLFSLRCLILGVSAGS